MLAVVPNARADGTVNVLLEDASEGGNLSGMKMEKQIMDLGEVSDPPPGKSGSITLGWSPATIC